MPFRLPPAPPKPLTLTDDMRRQVLAEQKAHCAASTWATFCRSLRAHRYPLDVTRFM